MIVLRYLYSIARGISDRQCVLCRTKLFQIKKGGIMTKKIFLLIAVALFFGCTKQSISVDIANACAADNEKKYITTSGYIDDKGSIFCSNTGGRMDCSLDFIAAPGGERVFGADIEQGSGASEIEKFEGSYKRDDLKIHDASGALIKLSDKVKVTGEMNVVPGSTCFMEIDKIEKAQ